MTPEPDTLPAATRRRLVAPSDLVDLTEIGERCHPPRTGPTVLQWRYRYAERDPFPEPWRHLAVGPVWLWQDVEPWLARNGRLQP